MTLKLLLTLCLILSIGCGGGPTATSRPVGNPINNPAPSGPASGAEFLYQVSFADDIHVSSVNPSTGTLGLPVDAEVNSITENMGLAPIATPSGKFLYVQGFDQPGAPPIPPVNAIYCFSISGSKGELTSLRSSPFISSNLGDPSSFIGFTPNGMAVDKQGQFLYLSEYDGINNSGQAMNAIRMYTIDGSTGALQNGPVLTSTAEGWLAVEAIAPNNKYLYATTLISNRYAISVFQIDPTTGVLTQITGSPFFVTNAVQGVVYNLFILADPAGKFVYAIATNDTYGSPGAFAFSVDGGTGALALVPGSPFPIGDHAVGALLHPSGKFLYVRESDTRLSAFPIDTMNGTIAAAPIFSAVTDNYFGVSVIDPSGQVLLLNDSYNTAASFLIDSSTGLLTSASASSAIVAPGWASAVIVKIP